MKLSGLLDALAVKTAAGLTRRDGTGRVDPEIAALHFRSQEVQPGGLFVAVPGSLADGHAFIPEALHRGAVAVVTERPVPATVPVIEVANARQALARLAARFYGHPSEKLALTGVTGTNGKTTTCFLIESILDAAGFKTGVIGTLNTRFGNRKVDSLMTTPESLDLQRTLAQMLAAGVTQVVMEVSSHAIDLERIEQCAFDVGVFTNLSQDHLDYHRDLESYWACKQKLFTHYLASGSKSGRAIAVVNCDDPRGRDLAAVTTVKTLTVGRQPDSVVRPLDIRCTSTGLQGRLATPRGEVAFVSALAGDHNLQNIVCAAGAALGLGVPLAAVKTGIEAVRAVPGRLERVADPAGRLVFVDYAHTPNALENVLSVLRSMAPGKLLCVFGCGGDRDPHKRPQMGEIAARGCDLAIITSDNPRSEAPLTIIEQILKGTRRITPEALRLSDLGPGGIPAKGYVAEPDRKAAIEGALRISQPGDTVLIAGKGHETYQIIGGRRIPFDDRLVARDALLRAAPGSTDV